MMELIQNWKMGLKEFSPFFKLNQLVSLFEYIKHQSPSKEKEDMDIYHQLEFLRTKDLSKTLLLMEHSNPLQCSLVLNNLFNIKPILTFNNFVFHSSSLINSTDYKKQLLDISYSLNRNLNASNVAFIFDSERYLESHDNVNFEAVYLNEYENTPYDLPNESFIKDFTQYDNVLYLTDKNYVKDDMEIILNSYQKFMPVKRIQIK